MLNQLNSCNLVLGIYTEKAHLLDSVINNIQLKSDYYQEAELSFVVRERDSLFSCYENKGKATYP